MSQITVGCKLPHGLHLDVGGKRVTLNGANSTEIVDSHGVKTGLTQVDKEFFDAWMGIYKGSAFVKSGAIFASENQGKVKAEAAEKRKVKTGFEGLDPDAPAPGIVKDDGK